MPIRVVQTGLLTTVQDQGRWAGVHMGIPVCGAMDPFASMAANVLVGNSFDAAVLEITAIGPTLLFTEGCAIALAGGNLGPRIDGRDLEGWRAYLVKQGASLEFSGRQSGARSYLAVSGGINVEPWLGSRSTYLTGGVGGFHGRAIREGDSLQIGQIGKVAVPPPNTRGNRIRPEDRPPYRANPTVRVVLGPHADQFTEDGIRTLLSASYQITNNSNRMGFHLQGTKISHVKTADTSSCGIPLGGIQVPGDGQPIVLLADHQVTGGYAMIATVIQSDIPLLAQCLPGECLTFRETTLEEARDSIKNQMQYLQRLRAETEHNLWMVQ